MVGVENNTTLPDTGDVTEQFKPGNDDNVGTLSPKQAPETPPPAPGGT